jgi:hypothetical protein
MHARPGWHKNHKIQPWKKWVSQINTAVSLSLEFTKLKKQTLLAYLGCDWPQVKFRVELEINCKNKLAVTLLCY